jgi:hypothetical protein
MIKHEPAVSQQVPCIWNQKEGKKNPILNESGIETRDFLIKFKFIISAKR